MVAVASQTVAPAHVISKLTLAEADGKVLDGGAADSGLTIPRGEVTATLSYFKPPEDGSVPFNFVGAPPAGQPKNNYGEFVGSVQVQDIRGHEDEYSLDNDAFKVISNVPESAEKEFASDESIKKNYYPEVEQLLLDHVPGSHRIFLFDHTIRRPPRGEAADRTPVLKAHVDQTATSAVQRVKLHLGDDAEKLLQGRYRIINVWRPLNGPVLSFPLAFASSASVEGSDLVAIEHRYPDRTGQTAGVVHNAGQRWHYWSGIGNDERLLLECFDSETLKEGSSVRGGRVPHSAFVDPRTPAGAPFRESIEVRALVFGP